MGEKQSKTAETGAIVGGRNTTVGQAADKRTVETADRLHAMIESELEALKNMKDHKWKFWGDPVDKSARLANSAAAVG